MEEKEATKLEDQGVPELEEEGKENSQLKDKDKNLR